MAKTRLQQKQDAYIVEYPEAISYGETQQHIAWLASEIPVEDDIQGVTVSNTEAENHATQYILKLFTKYETSVGNYWVDSVYKKYPRHDIQRMAITFAATELNTHAVFYNALNEALNLDTEEFYTDYLNDPVLKERMEFLETMIKSKDDLLSLATFSMIEGAVLYSSFAFFKHFRHGGKNKYKNLVSGINFSVRDENLHSEAGAWLYRTHKSECNLSDEKLKELEDKIITVAEKIYEHEVCIIDNIFAKGSIEGISPAQLKNFVQSRLNLCLKQFGMNNHWKVTYNPISDWFYDDINSVKLHDFFDTTGSEYNRKWNQDKFTWPKLEET